MNVLTSAIEAIVLKFERATNNYGNERYKFTFWVKAEAPRDELKAALNDLSSNKSIKYANLDYKPVMPAKEAGIAGVVDGTIVYADFLVTTDEPNPFTVNGTDYCTPIEAQEVETLVREKGRHVRVQLNLRGVSPRAARADGKGELPWGNVYCNPTYIVPLGKVTKIGNALSAQKIDLKGVATLNLEHAADQREAKAGDAGDADIEI